MHLFGHTFDHDYYFELPREGERDTHSIARCFTSHHGLIRAFPRANRTFSTARNPIPCASSSTNERFSRHGDLGDLPSSPHRQVDILPPPFREGARRDLLAVAGTENSLWHSNGR